MYTYVGIRIFTARAHGQKPVGIMGLEGETDEETGHSNVVLQVPQQGEHRRLWACTEGYPTCLAGLNNYEI